MRLTCQNVRGRRCDLLSAGVSEAGTSVATSRAAVVVASSGAGVESDMVVESKLRATASDATRPG